MNNYNHLAQRKTNKCKTFQYLEVWTRETKTQDGKTLPFQSSSEFDLNWALKLTKLAASSP